MFILILRESVYLDVPKELTGLLVTMMLPDSLFMSQYDTKNIGIDYQHLGHSEDHHNSSESVSISLIKRLSLSLCREVVYRGFEAARLTYLGFSPKSSARSPTRLA